MTEVKSIYSKIAKVMSQVNRVPKNGYNNFHKYNYATESDLTEAIRPILLESGLAFFSSVLEQERTGEFTKVKMEFTLADIETGEVLKSIYWGEGQDKGDKGLYKAYTGATKYFLMKTFLIPTGDDPESDSSVDERNGRQTPQNYQSSYQRMPQRPSNQYSNKVTPPQLKAIYAKVNNISKETGKESGAVYFDAIIACGLPANTSSKHLTKEQASQLIEYLTDLEPVKAS